jgi:hypothetical protein
MWKLGLRAHNSFSGNISFEFPVVSLCSVVGFDWLVADWLVGWLVAGWLVGGWLVGGWLAGWLFGWLVGWLAG